MLRVTLDAFSGRDNPNWVMPALPALPILRRIAVDLGYVVSPDAVPAVLGYRGLNLELLSPELRLRLNLPSWLSLVPGLGGGLARHAEQVMELIWLASKLGAGLAVPGFASQIRLVERFLADLVASTGKPPPAAGPLRPAGPCAFEMLPYDPGFWNDPAHIRRNNCYAYATNQRTDTFPQPGRASGRPMRAMTCAEAIAASLSDGAHEVNDCFDDSERPRLLVALVIWPGADGDYHWYRKHADFWGHKPGQTAARNVDSSGNVITDPERCDRGPYTDFCGYFLIPKSQRVA
jgi:hypothetical protein